MSQFYDHIIAQYYLDQGLEPTNGHGRSDVNHPGILGGSALGASSH